MSKNSTIDKDERVYRACEEALLTVHFVILTRDEPNLYRACEEALLKPLALIDRQDSAEKFKNILHSTLLMVVQTIEKSGPAGLDDFWDTTRRACKMIIRAIDNSVDDKGFRATLVRASHMIAKFKKNPLSHKGRGLTKRNLISARWRGLT